MDIRLLDKTKDLCLRCNRCSLHKGASNRSFPSYGIVPSYCAMIISDHADPISGEILNRKIYNNINNALQYLNLDSHRFYFTAIVKCGSNDNNWADGILKCMPFLKVEVASVKPKLLVALGRDVFESLCDESYNECVDKKLGYSAQLDKKVYPAAYPFKSNDTNKFRSQLWKIYDAYIMANNPF